MPSSMPIVITGEGAPNLFGSARVGLWHEAATSARSSYFRC